MMDSAEGSQTLASELLEVLPLSVAIDEGEATWSFKSINPLPPDSGAGSKDASKNPETGQECKVKELYEGPEKCKCCINWVEGWPKDYRNDIEEREETKRFALITRWAKNHKPGKALSLHSLTVQSPHLKSILGAVFKGYGYICTSLKQLVFEAPFYPFVHEWSTLASMEGRMDDYDCRKHLQLLLEILRDALEDVITTTDDLKRNGVVSFEYLWSIFRPGTELYTLDDGHNNISKLVRMEYREATHEKEAHLDLEVRQIAFDGKVFGYHTTHRQIGKFEGVKKITDLDIFPAARHPRNAEVKKGLVERGKIFRELHSSGNPHLSYNGPLMQVVRTWNGSRIKKHNIDERVIIDPFSLPDSDFDLKPLTEESHEPRVNGTDIRDGFGQNIKSSQTLESLSSNPSKPLVSHSSSPTDNVLHLFRDQVHGYSLKSRIWGSFYVDGLQDIKWNESAIDRLRIPEKQKDIIIRLTRNHVANNDKPGYVIEGKGQGVIMLLEGPPGVGKTLTAEALAEKLHKPLYVVGTASLNHDPEELETSLDKIRKLADRWNAVLLLDEGDVFLKTRSDGQFMVNNVVAVFLRMLEYYRGVMVITTNRARYLDSAVNSRMNLRLRYRKPGREARRSMWEDCVESSGMHTLEDRHFDRLKWFKLSGREIKNIVGTAQLLAVGREEGLSIHDICKVLKAQRINIWSRRMDFFRAT
ncbi:AAA+ ATPase domain-containing protein [Madurella fahalii]|uniref:AAA+ ATPase domain-containing protein n=1 Tax=Madurella fahalii TaxID=1157608 RepID=A0ABQ0GCZ1_9PEZI